MIECVYGDPTCPCQDGDLCHYVDDPETGTPAMAPPPEAANLNVDDDVQVDLIAFIKARLDEERALADKAAANVRDNPFWGNDWSQGMTGGMGGPGGDLAAVFSPDRVMAEVEAKRAILEMYTAEDPHVDAYWLAAILQAIRHLALVYRDHPDYRLEEWL